MQRYYVITLGSDKKHDEYIASEFYYGDVSSKPAFCLKKANAKHYVDGFAAWADVDWIYQHHPDRVVGVLEIREI